MVYRKKSIEGVTLKNDYDAVDVAISEISETHQAENRILRSQAWRRFFKWAAIFSLILAISGYILMQGYWSMNRPYPLQKKVTKKELTDRYKADIVVENFVKFTEIKHNISQVGDVIIGRRYENENYTRPSAQWCYVKTKTKTASETTLTLKETSIIPIPTIEELTKLNLTYAEFEKLKSYCIFD